MLCFAAVYTTLRATSAFARVRGSPPNLTSAFPSHLFKSGYATDLVSQQLQSRWEVPAGSDLRVSARSPADVHVTFGEPDAISVQVQGLQEHL